MDLTVQAQLLGALQREGLCQTPCRSGEPHSPHPAPTHPHGPKEELSLLQQFGATTRYSQYEENTQKGALCSVRSAIGTLQANLGDFFMHSCTTSFPQTYHGCGSNQGKTKSLHARFPRWCVQARQESTQHSQATGKVHKKCRRDETKMRCKVKE